MPSRLECGLRPLYNKVKNAHGAVFRELFYHWHPWFGMRVAIHEAIEKVDGVVFRCTLSSSAADRWLEVPAWMFDRSACPHPPRLTTSLLLAWMRYQCCPSPAGIEVAAVILECAAFWRIQVLSRPESGRGP
jgi:hypothetical protein